MARGHEVHLELRNITVLLQRFSRQISRRLSRRWVVPFGLVVAGGCSTPTAGPCADGLVLKDGFCTPVVCDAGQRVVDGACVPVTCGPNTTLEGEECVSSDTTAPITAAAPASGTYSGSVRVTLTANEPAVVFYTIDGSTPNQGSTSGPSPVTLDLDATADVRFFAVDAAGNEESALSVSYTVDAAGPEPVTGLTAADISPAVDLTWTNPSDADLSSVLIVRGRAEPLGWQPANGTAYAVGDEVAPGVVVVANANGESHTDNTPWGDRNVYAAWGVDAVNNYSAAPATAELALPVPHQPITLDVDLDDVVATLGPQPPDLHVAVASAELSPNRDELTVTLRAENRMSRPIYNLKVAVRSLSVGTVDPDGTYDGDDAFYFGPNAVPPGDSRTVELRVTGLPLGTSAVALELDLATHPLIIASMSRTSSNRVTFLDPGSTFNGGVVQAIPGYALSLNGANSKLTTLDLSADGLQLYGGQHNVPKVTKLDLVTLTPVMSVDLGGPATPPVGHVETALSPDGAHVYAVLTTSIHGRNSGGGIQGNGGNPTDIELVKLDADTLAEVGRVSLMTALANGSALGLRPAISADGTRVAVPIIGPGRLAWVNADTMSLLFNAVLSNAEPRAAVVAPGNAMVFVSYLSAEVARVSTLNQVETPVNTGYTSGTCRPATFERGPGDMLFLARSAAPAGLGGIVRIHPTTFAFENLAIGTTFTGLAFQGDDFAVAVRRSTQLMHLIDATTFTQLDTGPITVSTRGHGVVITPTPLLSR